MLVSMYWLLPSFVIRMFLYLCGAISEEVEPPGLSGCTPHETYGPLSLLLLPLMDRVMLSIIGSSMLCLYLNLDEEFQIFL